MSTWRRSKQSDGFWRLGRRGKDILSLCDAGGSALFQLRFGCRSCGRVRQVTKILCAGLSNYLMAERLHSGSLVMTPRIGENFVRWRRQHAGHDRLLDLSVLG